MRQITFIGLGHMGVPMVTNLPKAGYLLNAFDLVQSAVDGLVAAGASAVRSARDATRDVDVVTSTLPTSQHVESLCLDDDGLLAHIAPDTLVLRCSTTVPTSTRKAHIAARERGLAMLDTSVSGDTADAAVGTLTLMVDDDAEALEKARPLLKAMGRNTFHTDPDGAGQVVKVCNNQLLTMLVIGIAEVTVLGAANGLEAEVLAEIMRRSLGGNRALEVHNPWPGTMENAPASRDYSGDFTAQLMAKDLGLAQEAVQANANNTSMGGLALSLYRLLLKQGYVERDFPVVQKLFDSTQGQQTNRWARAQTGRFDGARSPP